MAHNLKQEFPDLNESVIGQVLTSCKNDERQAKAILEDMGESKEKERHLVKELKTSFPNLSEKIIYDVLKQCDWNVEEAIVPLVHKSEELERERKKKELKDRRKNEEQKINTKRLTEAFRTISPETIHQVLEENEGDIDETTTQLLQILKEQEEKASAEKDKRRKEEQEQALRLNKIHRLEEDFTSIPREKIESILKEVNWDLKKACLQCQAIDGEQKVKELKVLFPVLKEWEIQKCLYSNNWDKKKATEELVNMLAKREITEEKAEQRKDIEKKMQESLLENSIIRANELEQRIKHNEKKQQKKKLEAEEKFKEDLEKIIANQARFGAAPGVAPPPLPKEIKARSNKPVDDSYEQEIAKDASTKSGSVILRAYPTVADCGNPITVEYEILDGNTSTWDWIGLFLPQNSNKNYYTYQYRGKSDIKGTVVFNAPSSYGEYEFRYFSGVKSIRSYEHIVISNKIVVGPEIDISATLDKEQGKIVAKWNKKSGNYYYRAWIGLYEKNEKNNKQYIHWEYASSNEVSFDAPIKPGNYELRFFPYSYNHVATSEAIQINGEDKIYVSLTPETIDISLDIVTVDPHQDGAWLGLFLKDEPDNHQWTKYKYFKERKTLVQFKKPKKSGEYEIRMFANRSYEVLLKSTTLSITV